MARKDIVDRIGRLARAVANADRKRDDPGVEKWAIRLADASSSLAVLVNPDLGEEDAVFAELVPIPVAKVLAEPAPNFGVRPEMSSGLYNEWVAAWWVANFAGLASVDYGTIAAKATADGCLAQVCAAGKLGTPEGPTPGLGDWSLFTALTSTDDDGPLVHRVYHMGALVGTQTGGNGLEFAHSLGFNW